MPAGLIPLDEWHTQCAGFEYLNSQKLYISNRSDRPSSQFDSNDLGQKFERRFYGLVSLEALG